MFRVVTAKRCLAAAAAGIAVAAVVPALASADTTATGAVAAPPSVTIDFSGSNSEAGAASTVGAGFGGRATVRDANGAEAGTAYDVCDKDAINAKSVTAMCQADIVFNSGDQVAFTVVVPIQNPLTATYPTHFEGVITGGTGAYQGLTGTVHFTNTATAVYRLDFES